MAVFKRSNSPNYYVEFEFEGQRIQKSARTTSKREAEDFERELRRQLRDQLLLGRTAPPTMTTGEAVERYIVSHLNTRRRRQRTAEADAYLLNRLVNLLGGPDVLLYSITTKQISELRDSMLHEGKKAATVNRYLATLKAILRKAHLEWDELPQMPLVKLAHVGNKVDRWLNNSEEAELLKAAKEQKHLHDLIVFLIDTGARLGEATGLTWSYVDFHVGKNGSVRFIQTKSDKPRSVPLTNRVSKLLKELKQHRPSNEPHVFLRRTPGCAWRNTKPQAKPFSNPHGAWNTAKTKAGLLDVRLHDLRHTFASRLVQAGNSLQVVSELLGHSDIKMTMRYAHLTPDNHIEAIETLNHYTSSTP